MLLDQVEAILKDLATRKKLTASEKQFKLDAENGHIIDIIEKEDPRTYVWENKDGSLTKLKSSRFRYSDDDYENDEYHKNKEILDSKEGFRTELEEYLELLEQVSVRASSINKKYRLPNENGNYNFNQKLDYATNGTKDSLINQFGHYVGDEGVPTIL